MKQATKRITPGLADRLIRLREIRFLPQMVLAMRAGISIARLYQVERCEVAASETLNLLTRALQVDGGGLSGPRPGEARPVRIVLDTNVVVSGLLSSSFPFQVLEAVWSERVTPLYDDRVLAEYRKVLSRPKFGFAAEMVEETIRNIERLGEWIDAIPSGVALPDPTDAPFFEVALSGRADALATGNGKHFPGGHGVRVLTPRELAELLGG